jgi:hypothetical protein
VVWSHLRLEKVEGSGGSLPPAVVPLKALVWQSNDLTQQNLRSMMLDGFGAVPRNHVLYVLTGKKVPRSTKS